MNSSNSLKHVPAKTNLLLGIFVLLQIGFSPVESLAQGDQPTTEQAGTFESTPSTGKSSAPAEDNQFAPAVFHLAVRKLASKQRLSAEEYRSLGIGVAGFEAYQKFFQENGQITRVYADSPADKAGIRVGDKIVERNEGETVAAMEKANPMQPLVKITFKRVGQPVDVTILRNEQPVKITLNCMNVEDIKEKDARRMWEKTIRDLGFPDSGSYVGPSVKSLVPTR